MIMDGQSDGQQNPSQMRAFSWDSSIKMINGWTIWPSTNDKEILQLIRVLSVLLYVSTLDPLDIQIKKIYITSDISR